MPWRGRSVDAYIGRGRLFYEDGDYESALEDFRKALEYDTDSKYKTELAPLIRELEGRRFGE